MRRALIALGGTAAGLAALLSFKTHSLAATAPEAAGPPSASASAPSASAGMSQPASGGTAAGSASPGAGQQAGASPKSSASAKASPGSPASVRTVTGTVASTQYGPMQVQLSLAGTKITKVNVLQRTDDGAESDQIDENAIPKLTSETIAAQGAHIDAVSGATYTSSGYIQSLQSAVDQAGL